MADYGEVMEYIPLIGDIYRYGKLGFNIMSWLCDDDVDAHNYDVVRRIGDTINRALDSKYADDVVKIIDQGMEIVNEFDSDKAKKYQRAVLLYLVARMLHIHALAECIILQNDLEGLKQVSSTFALAKKACIEADRIPKTYFTAKRSLIDQIRTMCKEKRHEISASKSQWRKQYRCLYKKTYPVRWYLGMWLFA